MKKYLTLIFLIIILFKPSGASNVEGTKTYDDYLFILVHGIRSDSGIFTGQKDLGDLKAYLETNLGLTGRVFCYTFKDINGDNRVAAEEFGNRAYNNDAPGMNAKCWLDKAKDDFFNDKRNAGEPLPSKFIVITHSMGNMAVRSYIYSEKVFGAGKGFYNDDIAKVVFVAPPLLGSDMVIASWKLQYDIITSGLPTAWDYSTKIYNFFANNGIGESFDLWKMSQGFITGTLSNPMGLYMVAAWIATADIYGEETLKEWGGLNTLKPTYRGMWDMLPHSELVEALKDAELSDPTKEPAYSIVYGRGIPVYDCYSTWGMAAIKSLHDLGELKWGKQAMNTEVGNYMPQKGYPEILSQFIKLDYKWLTLANPNFYNLPTSQAKLMSFLQANAMNGFFTNDGDGLVPTYSAKGEGVKSVQNAPKYDYIFKTQPVEDYFSNDFLIELAAAETAIYAASTLTGAPSYTFWPLRFYVALHIVEIINQNGGSLRDNLKAHGKILEQYDLIKKAILDTPAIFTINDLHATSSGEGSSSNEATSVKSFSAGAPIPPGYESIKIKSIEENRNATGTISLPIPMSLDGQRMYATSLTVTKPPKRIAGKLNYLIPALMKNFEYSFNFAAWKPITGVNPETGEFALEDMPFAEGQNVLAIRAENAVGIKSNQILTIIVNTIPLLPSGFTPVPNSFTNNNQPEFSVNFAKSSYSASSLESVNLTKAMLRNETTGTDTDITSDVQTTQSGGIYDKRLKVSYAPPVPLDDGKYTILVVVNSNVGTAQALWGVTIDTTAPTVNTEPLKPYSPKASSTGNLVIKYSASDEASDCLGKVFCDLFDQSGNLITEIATEENITSGEHYFNWNGLTGKLVNDGNYNARIKVFDLAGNASTSSASLTIDSTPPEITEAKITPKVMTSKKNEMKLEANISEKAQVYIKMTEIFTNAISVYLGSAAKNTLAYSWNFDNSFIPGPKDGIYNIELVAQDEAGNISDPLTIEAYQIDRTPPKVYGQTTLPYVLSNSGKNPYTTKVLYRISEEDKAIGNRKESLDMLHKQGIKLYHEQ